LFGFLKPSLTGLTGEQETQSFAKVISLILFGVEDVQCRHITPQIILRTILSDSFQRTIICNEIRVSILGLPFRLPSWLCRRGFAVEFMEGPVRDLAISPTILVDLDVSKGNQILKKKVKRASFGDSAVIAGSRTNLD
jgi:hypothetical protein